MKIAIIVIIFISGLIIIHLLQKTKDLESQLDLLARLIFESMADEDLNEYSYKLEEDEEGTIQDASGRRFKMIKIKVDKKK